jgi:hypothetical protein
MYEELVEGVLICIALPCPILACLFNLRSPDFGFGLTKLCVRLCILAIDDLLPSLGLQGSSHAENRWVVEVRNYRVSNDENLVAEGCKALLLSRSCSSLRHCRKEGRRCAEGAGCEQHHDEVR